MNGLAVKLAFLEADSEELSGKIFGLDVQIIFDAVILALAVFFLFFLLSYFVFNPARDYLEKRRERVASDLAAAAEEKRETEENPEAGDGDTAPALKVGLVDGCFKFLWCELNCELGGAFFFLLVILY